MHDRAAQVYFWLPFKAGATPADDWVVMDRAEWNRLNPTETLAPGPYASARELFNDIGQTPGANADAVAGRRAPRTVGGR